MNRFTLMCAIPFWGAYRFSGGNWFVVLISIVLTMCVWFPGVFFTYMVAVYYTHKAVRKEIEYGEELKSNDPTIKYEITKCSPKLYFSSGKKVVYLVEYPLSTKKIEVREIPFDKFAELQHTYTEVSKLFGVARINNFIEVSVRDPDFPRFYINFDKGYEQAKASQDKILAILES